MARDFQFEFENTAQTYRVAPPRASRSRPFVELRQSLPSRITAIEPFVEQLMSFISKFRPPDGSETDIELALQEAIANAVIHGNGEKPNKRVYVVCRCNIEGEVSITVCDQGPGFKNCSVPDPTTRENRMCAHGRGIYLMQSLMDEVYFEEDGAIVHMRKKSSASQSHTGDQNDAKSSRAGCRQEAASH
jgi:serine/threonine-protein kinase RsbW